MATAVINAVIVEEPAQEIVIIKKKRSTLKKRLIITEDLGPVATPLHEEVITPQKSIWLQMRRTPKVYPTIVWEGIEDISDDEDNSPQTAGRNLSKMKQTRDRIRHRQYAIKVDELQGAGLFLNWGKYFE